MKIRKYYRSFKKAWLCEISSIISRLNRFGSMFKLLEAHPNQTHFLRFMSVWALLLMSLIADFWKLYLLVYLGELCKSFSLNLKSLDSAFSSKPGITDQISKSLTNSGQSSVERGSKLNFNFDFTQFREKRILRIGNAAVWFLAVPQAALIFMLAVSLLKAI